MTHLNNDNAMIFSGVIKKQFSLGEIYTGHVANLASPLVATGQGALLLKV